MKHVFMTGATGAFGSEILSLLTKKGFSVTCLVRANSQAAANKRIRDVLGVNHQGVKVVLGDITLAKCGISKYQLKKLRGNVDLLLHCAAAISFTDEVQNWKVNVGGVNNVKELVDELDVHDWHHVSTAYTIGKKAALFEDDVIPHSEVNRPRNTYEETKQIGESVVEGWGKAKSGRTYTIYRPSILVGRDDELGSTPTFDAFYGYVWPLWKMAESVRQKIRDGKALGSGISVNSDDVVNVPIVIKMEKTSTLNVVPIDWAAKVLVLLLSIKPGENAVYHITHNDPPNTRWMLEIVLDFFGVSGVQVVATQEEYEHAVKKLPKGVLAYQRSVASVLQRFSPYTNHNPFFSMDRCVAHLGSQFEPPPIINKAFIEKLLNYAVTTEWGNKPHSTLF